MAYDKANSLLAIAADADATAAAAQRVVQLEDRAFPTNSTAYERDIVRQARADVIASMDVAGGEAPTLDTSPDVVRFHLRPHVVEELSRIRDDELFRYLFYRYRYEVFPAAKRLDAFPPCLQIEPTSICNYRCVFCYHTVKEFTDPANGHMGHMGLDLFKRIIDEAAGQCEAITLASRGEPLLCPDIEAMLAYLAGKALASKINTNAWLLDEHKAHAILSADLQTIVFSVDAASEPLYSRLRVNGKLDRVMRNIRRFAEIRAKHYPQSRCITRISGVQYHPEQDIDEMRRVWGDYVDQVAFVSWHNTHEREKIAETRACSELWRRTFVWFDGRVNPCEVDFMSRTAVGSLASASISDLWRSEAYERRREAHLQGRRGGMEPCSCCSTV